MSVIVSGDDVALPTTLRKDGKTFAINPTATIKASLISEDRETILISPVDVLEATGGSDWSNSLIVVAFPSASTLGLTPTAEATIEVQVDDGGKLTWFTSIEISKGTIS